MITRVSRRQDWRTLVLPVGLLVAVSVLLVPIFAHAIDVWSTDEEFTYGFLIPPVALAIAWWRRNALRRSISEGQRGGLLIVALSIIAILVSRRTGINALAGIAISPLLIGMAAYLWGWRAARVAAFPSMFLVFGLGLYRGLLSSVGFALQDITAIGAAWMGKTIGLDVVRDGLVLHSTASSSSFSFIVAQTCSGMSSLLSLLALAALWMYATRGHSSRRAVVFASVLPLVIVANTTRVTLVLLVASLFGQDTALGFFHGASSLVLFSLALVGLLIVSRSVGCKLPTFATLSS
jgi:exosortase